MILIALGANLPSRFGTPDVTLSRALDALAGAGIVTLKKSRLWATAPVPYDPAQPDYLNAVISVDTRLGPEDVMRALLFIEQDFGRVRTTLNAPRAIDLDLLAYGNRVMNTEFLILPHPRMDMRAFVLMPLMDVAPEWEHPVFGTSLFDMVAGLPEGQSARPAGAWPA